MHQILIFIASVVVVTDKYDVFTNRWCNDNMHMINQTVDAEIKVIMIPQRAGDAENPAENKSSNGPPRVQSNAI